MTRVISFASGNLWSWNKSQNIGDWLSYIKELNVSGVEITFSSKEELYAFKLSKQNEEWLKGLEYVTIHAPFNLVKKSNNEGEVVNQLKIISRLYTEIHAKNVIIHPEDLPNPKVLDRFNLRFSTENMSKNRGISISNLKKIFKKYPKVGLCLDVSHAYLWSKHETENLVNAFENKITQVHFSGTYRKIPHQSLQFVSNSYICSIKPLSKLNVPIIIEENIRIKSKKYVKREIEFIRNMLKIDKLLHTI